jgi:small subunit ribosomal protein S5
MAEENKEAEKIVEEVPEVEEITPKATPLDSWHPKTELGKKVKSGEINDIMQILGKGTLILEPEIVDFLVPNLETDYLLIGQAKGKFGGGKRRIFKQTQKKTREGNKPKFATIAIVGNRNGLMGIGYGKSKETVPAREKALRAAKLNIFSIYRGSGSWESKKDEPHSIPFAVEGKCSSVIIRLLPAPKGTGLITEREVAKMLKMVGIEDVWSKTLGQTRTKMNLIRATENALRSLMRAKVHQDHYESLHIFEGPVEKRVVENEQ